MSNDPLARVKFTNPADAVRAATLTPLFPVLRGLMSVVKVGEEFAKGWEWWLHVFRQLGFDTYDVLENDAQRVERLHKSPHMRHVHHANVLDAVDVAKDAADVVLWWYGPEKLPKRKFSKAINALKDAFKPKVIIVGTSSWGPLEFRRHGFKALVCGKHVTAWQVQPSGMLRGRTIRYWLGRLASESFTEPPFRALEIGRIRSLTESVGWSTLHIAAHAAVESLVSVDSYSKTESVTRAVVPQNLHEKIEFVNAKSTEWMADALAGETAPFGFIYLDGANDAEICLSDLKQATKLSRPGTIIILDDTDPRAAKKCLLTLPWIKKHPKAYEIVQEVPPCETCQGILVVRVK